MHRLDVPLHIFGQRKLLAANVAMKHFARMIANHVRVESFAMRTFLAANLGRNIGMAIRELVGRFMRQSVKIYEKATEATSERRMSVRVSA